MNPFEFVLALVFMIGIFGVLKARSSGRRRWRNDCGEPEEVSDEHAENARLREEVRELKERLHVLERITVEKENSLSREIESLRDR